MKSVFSRVLNLIGYKIIKTSFKPKYRRTYKKFKQFTMMPEDLYCENLAICERYKAVSGNIVECGVWRGGMIAGIAETIGQINKKYYLLDSFEGLPNVQEIDGEKAINWQKENIQDNCKAELKEAEKAMSLAEIQNFEIIKGWFNNTLPTFSIEKIVILRLDGDWYESIHDCLYYLFPKLEIGGLLIVDDYHIWDGTSKAIHDYLSSIKSSSKINISKGGVMYIIKI